MDDYFGVCVTLKKDMETFKRHGDSWFAVPVSFGTQIEGENYCRYYAHFFTNEGEYRGRHKLYGNEICCVAWRPDNVKRVPILRALHEAKTNEEKKAVFLEHFSTAVKGWEYHYEH